MTSNEIRSKFLEYFKKLNKFGLLYTPTDAKDFLEYYLSFDWTETGEYKIAEVFLIDSKL